MQNKWDFNIFANKITFDKFKKYKNKYYIIIWEKTT